MKFELTHACRADRRRLSDSERSLFDQALPAFVAACDRYAADPSTAWPAALRVKAIQGAPGIFEMTWSFKGPDGRATFEFIQIDGALGVRWRRIGDHSILERP